MTSPHTARAASFMLLLALAAGCDKGGPANAGGGKGGTGPNAATIGVGAPDTVPADLFAARAKFQTNVRDNPAYQRDGAVDPPPAKLFSVVKYKSPAGDLAAYVTPDPKDGKKRPAVVWAHGGFGGVSGGSFWAKADPRNDQSAAAFRDAGCVLMIPSWRGENENPGRYEMFYGEIDDFLAARDYVAALPYVDPDRVYLAGHSTGGTITLLAACASDKFRAAFSFGGAPDVYHVVGDGQGYGNTPFDHRNRDESFYRSATNFVAGIKRPTFYFEGCSDGYNNGYCPDADAMAKKAKAANVPFQAFALPWGNHFSILYKVTRQVANKIKADTGKDCNITFDKAEVSAR